MLHRVGSHKMINVLRPSILRHTQRGSSLTPFSTSPSLRRLKSFPVAGNIIKRFNYVMIFSSNFICYSISSSQVNILVQQHPVILQKLHLRNSFICLISLSPNLEDVRAQNCSVYCLLIPHSELFIVDSVQVTIFHISDNIVCFGKVYRNYLIQIS